MYGPTNDDRINENASAMYGENAEDLSRSHAQRPQYHEGATLPRLPIAIQQPRRVLEGLTPDQAKVLMTLVRFAVAIVSAIAAIWIASQIMGSHSNSSSSHSSYYGMVPASQPVTTGSATNLAASETTASAQTTAASTQSVPAAVVLIIVAGK